MRIAIPLLMSLLLTTACSAGQDEIKKNLQARYPNIEINSVTESPIKGLYEVVVQGSQVIYTDGKADYLIDGMLIDTASKRNLTQEKILKLSAVNFDSLPLDQAIKIVRGDGKRRLAVFSDPDCPFCKRLEPELAKLDNVTIYIFEYPLAMHADAAHKSRLVWCSPDRAKAWDDLMLRGKLPEGKDDCANPISANLALGEKLNVQGTPHLILPNGQRIPGMVPYEKLEMMLKQASGQ
jgi:thiol:disulfide interchange protein DsbC